MSSCPVISCKTASNSFLSPTSRGLRLTCVSNAEPLARTWLQRNDISFPCCAARKSGKPFTFDGNPPACDGRRQVP